MIALLAVVPLPPLRGSQLFSTTFNAIPVLMILAALALYLWGVRRNGGLATTAFSVFSFIGVYDQELFWDHMVQHLLLIMVAAPLFAIASPIDLSWRASRGPWHERLTRVLRSRTATLLGHPGVAFVLYAVAIPLTHLTVWYNYTLEHESVHNAEHLVFLGVGYLFWRQIFGSDPNCYRMHPILQFGYLFLAIPIDTFTGLSIAIRWLHLEERRAIRADRLLDQQEAEAAATATSAAAAAAAAATAAATTAGTGALPGT